MVARGLVAAADAAGEVDLFLDRQEGSLGDFLKIKLQAAALERSGLAGSGRLGFFQNVLCGILELLMPLAIRWRASGKFVNPNVLTAALEPGPKRDAIRGAVNVRRTLVKSAGGVVLDTLGLGALGLPDFEVSLGDRMPPPFELMLKSVARYEYDLGDVIADGRTVKGGTESFRLTRATASVEPKRDVFVLRPG